MRIHFATSLALAVTASSLSAQAVSWTQPKGYTTTGTNSDAFTLGRYADGRQQMIYGDYHGTNHNRVIQGFQLRRSTTATNNNTGRSWSNVEIRVAPGNLQKITDAWDQNYLSTPTLVFSASVTFPSTTGAAATNPWGQFAAPGDMAFPFGSGGTTALWVDAGAMGVILDLQFTGGKFANGATWGATQASSYYTDGVIPNGVANVWAEGTTTGYGLTTCPVPGGTGTTSPDMRTWLFTDNTISGNQQHRWQFYGYDYPANHPCMGVVSFDKMSSSIPLPGFDSCQNLFLDLSKPYQLWPFTSDGNGDYIEDFYNFPLVPNSAGLEIFTQAALVVSGANYLTQPFGSVVPNPPANTTNYAAHLYHPNKARKQGFGPLDFRVPLVGLY